MSTTNPPRVNYLNNRDLLKEIHLSKNTYCSFRDSQQDHQYDIILPSVARINQRTVAEARRNRAARLTKETGQPVNEKHIPYTDLVFRVMTWEHIPHAPRKVPRSAERSRRSIEDILGFDELPEEDVEDLAQEPVLDATHVRVNFPPFWHYRLDQNRVPYVVGKSHWQGDLVTGSYNRDHGTMTRRLAEMFMKLCDRYATRSNWRGYCVDTETEALTKRGWLGINDISTADEILSYNGDTLAWSPVHSVYRGDFDGLMHKLTLRGFDSLITPNHKIVTARGLVPVELLKETDRMILLGSAVQTTHDPKHTDAFVELAGWILTEGCYEYNDQGLIKRITVYQNPGAKADRIRTCLQTLGYTFSESLRKNNICFGISRANSRTIVETLPQKNLSMEFILSLTQAQRDLLIETMIDGDGWRRPGGHRSYVQKDSQHVDLFMALCAISGVRTTTRLVNAQSFGKPTSYYSLNLLSSKKNTTSVHCVNFHGGKRNGRAHPGQGKVTHPNEPTTYYQGQVWCPETEYGSFVARRNGTVYLTGNTYNEEMRGQALLQLSQIGLQFDEAKSQNPFAYYTAAITNSFTRILNIEKKNQNIRDDILEINGLNPSWTRQYRDADRRSAEKVANSFNDV